MVKIKSSAGGCVNIHMLGIGEVVRRIQKAGQEIKQGADFGVIRAGGYVEEEVKESIAGNRAEPKSVRTGLFGNSIEFKKTGEAQGIVKSNPQTYPGTSTSTADVAKFLEKDRQHFANTRERTRNEVKEIIKKEIKKNIWFIEQKINEVII